MTKEHLKKLDEEDQRLTEELTAAEIDVEELLGFRLPKATCLTPFIPCGQNRPPAFSLVPLYEAVFLPVSAQYIVETKKGRKTRKISKVSMFKLLHGVTPDELAILAEKGRLIPYFPYSYVAYNEKIINPLIQLGVPKISPCQMASIRGEAIDRMSIEEGWENYLNVARKDTEKMGFPKGFGECGLCLSACYALGLRDYFHSSDYHGYETACFISYTLATRILDSVLQTECPIALDVLSNLGRLPERISIEYILKALKVNYSTGIPLEVYLDVFEGKTAKALRKILSDLLSDPLSRKYAQRLSAKIYDLNQQVQEIAEGRTAKIFEAVSDMALYGGKKFIEHKSAQYVRIPKKGLMRVAEWLASKGIDLQARISGKDWSIAQLYKARCKLEKCGKS